jgi:hypothetical protein
VSAPKVVDGVRSSVDHGTYVFQHGLQRGDAGLQRRQSANVTDVIVARPDPVRLHEVAGYQQTVSTGSINRTLASDGREVTAVNALLLAADRTCAREARREPCTPITLVLDAAETHVMPFGKVRSDLLKAAGAAHTSDVINFGVAGACEQKSCIER